MKIFYWSPFFTNIATIKAVYNSAKSLTRYQKNNEYDVIDLHSLFLNDNGEMNTSLSDDGIHLNKNGYSIWIDKVKPLIDNVNATN